MKRFLYFLYEEEIKVDPREYPLLITEKNCLKLCSSPHNTPPFQLSLFLVIMVFPRTPSMNAMLFPMPCRKLTWIEKLLAIGS